jgi:hypothetical protein
MPTGVAASTLMLAVASRPGGWDAMAGVGGLREGRAHERKSIEATMAEKPMVSESEPRKPRRESCMHKTRTSEPAPAETHAATALRANAGDVTATVAPSALAKQLTSLLIVPLPPCSEPQRG